VVTCIFQIFSPLNLICAVAAARTLFGDEWRGLILSAWPGLGAEQETELTATIRAIATAAPEVSFVPDIDALSTRIEASEAVPIFFAHDVVGEAIDRLKTAFPRARWICYGEGMGVAFDKRHVLDLLQNERPTFLNRLGIRKKPASWCEYVLAIPADQTGSLVEQRSLRVIPRSIVKTFIDQIRSKCPAIAEFETKTIGHRSRCALLMTENHAEGNFIKIDDEVALYVDILRKNVEPGAVVLVKPHPAEQFNRANAIRAAAPEFSILDTPHELRRFPVEVMSGLASNSTCICMSYPSVSLKYLYSTSVIQPMTKAIIKRWFPPNVWRSYMDALRIYDEQIAALDQWDGKSLLYRG